MLSACCVQTSLEPSLAKLHGGGGHDTTLVCLYVYMCTWYVIFIWTETGCWMLVVIVPHNHGGLMKPVKIAE